MKWSGKIIFFFLLLFLAKPLVLGQEPFERSIVVYREVLSENQKHEHLKTYRAQWNKDLKLINAAAASLPSSVVARLRQDPRVLRIDPDVEVFALPSDLSAEANITNQPIPWGVDKISAPSAWSISRGQGVKVAVVDTGIARSHADLNDNLAGCVNFIQSWKTCEDDNGHGTHVSGIIAAEDNSFGVVGVAPQARIYAYKVLNRRGSGYLSDIIEALDRSITDGVVVINMSLGTSSDVQSFHDAIIKVYNAGITQVAAAGNSGPGSNTVNYPGAYPEVIGVAATDSSNNVPSWSSRGPQVDIAAPGVSVYSTYLKNGYTTMSGTSMASPHVAGVAALRLFLKPGTSPGQIRSEIMTNADPLPFDPTWVGAGLVNAYKVVTAP